MTHTFNDVGSDDLDGLIQRVADAKEFNLSLSSEDIQLLLDALITLAHVQERIADKDITLHKLRKLLGMVKSSEKLSNLVSGAKSTSDEPADKHRREQRRKDQQRAKRRKKNKTTPKIKPKTEHHKLQGLTKGNNCVECGKGKLYKFEPAQLLRITGHSPYVPTLHVCERLRCNACGALITADLPAEVKADGDPQQKYGFSARSLMCIKKYFAGSPFYREESLQDLLGVKISASTVFDQCELVANDVHPIYSAIKQAMSDAVDFRFDDTKNRILNQKPIEKPRRNSDKTQLRSGIYTSGVIASLQTGQQAVLFKTNIGHAGELMDELLANRTLGLPPPTLMSDALSSNNPTVAIDLARALCNSHARRQFVDVLHQFPEQVEWVLNRYKLIWDYDDDAVEQELTLAERLAYHRGQSLPVMEEILAWCHQALADGSVEENSGLGKAMKYYIKHYEGLTAFCRVEDAPIDNNIIEGILKLVVRNRKNALFFKTLAGASVADVITSVIATAIQCGANAFEYFNAVQRNAEKVKANPELWMPWNYSA